MKTIKTKYLGATTYKGSRIVADDGDGNRVTLPYRCEVNSDENHAKAARALCEKMGWVGTLQGGERMKAGRTVGMVWTWLDKREQIRVKPLKSFTHPVA